MIVIQIYHMKVFIGQQTSQINSFGYANFYGLYSGAEEQTVKNFYVEGHEFRGMALTEEDYDRYSDI